MVLILAVISLAMMAALVLMITSSTQVSGVMKRYKSSTEAGKGGAAVMFQAIAAGGDPGYITGSLGGSIPAQATNVTFTYNGASMTMSCFNAKLSYPRSNWQGACNTSINIDPNTTSSYDVKFQLGTVPAYNVYAKIVDTVQGNSMKTVGGVALWTKGVVTASGGGGGEIQAVPKPYLYTLEVQATNSNAPAEKTNYSILYEY
jgi:hypothetical protein